MLLSATVRSIGKTRATSFAIIAFVAVGVTALATAFNIADAALWRSPPFHDAQSIVIINSAHTNTRNETRFARWSYPRIQLLKARASGFSHVANYTPTTTTLTGDGGAEDIQGEFVSPEYFGVAGVRPTAGRLFTALDDATVGGNPIVLISSQLWRERFQSRSGVIGKTLTIGGRVVSVVGVLEDGFRGLSGNAKFWMPTSMAPLINYPEYLTTDQNFINVAARLKPGIGLDRANTELGVLAPQVFEELPIVNADSGQRSSAIVRGIVELRTTPATRRSVLTLLAAVGLLYLLACTNVANLLLSKAAARRREIAVRQALGATTFRLLPSIVAESALLIFVGGAVGLVFAAWLNRFVPAPDQIWTASNMNAALASFAEPAFDLRSVAFGVSLITLTALLVSCIPAFGLVRVDMSNSLRDGARGFTVGGSTLKRPNARGVIVAIEAALAMVLFMAGSLMIDSFSRMRETELGIDSSHVLTFGLHVSEAAVPPERAPQFISRVLAEISAVPGVVSASVDGGAPVSGSASSTLLVVGRPIPSDDDQPPVLRHYVAPDHFKTLGIPVVAGRTFTAQDDENHPRVVIISELAAKRFWPDENPIGKRVWFGGGSSFNSPERSGEIVGIVGDVAYQRLDNEPFRPDFYTPYMQFSYGWRIYFVRTVGDPMSIITAIRGAVRNVAPDTPLRDVQSMESLIGKSWTKQRFDATIFGAFAVLALLLSATGIYAVVSYAIHQRTREMGIRLALGATRSAVLRLVIREGMAFPIAGLITGLVASLALGRLIASSLYELSPSDPLVLFRTFALLVAASVAACAVPAWRATRVDPLIAIRAD